MAASMVSRALLFPVKNGTCFLNVCRKTKYEELFKRTLTQKIDCRYDASNRSNQMTTFHQKFLKPELVYRQIASSAYSVPHMPYSTKFSDDAQKELIYTGPMNFPLKLLKRFSLTSSIMSAAFLPMILSQGNIGPLEVVAMGCATTFVFTPLIIQWFSRTYITELYFDEANKSYEAHTMNFFTMKVKHIFNSQQVELPLVRNVLASFLGNGKPFMVDPEHFVKHHDFNRLMGYDQMPEGLTEEELKKLIKQMKEDDEED